MTTRLVDVFDRGGAKLFTYSIALEEAVCLDAEFEEVALIFAERSGVVAAEEVPHLSARCEGVTEAVATAKAERPGRAKGKVFSLIKHRMKTAGTAPARHAKRHA